LLAGARFSGRSAGGFFDDFFGGGDGRMNATGADRTLQVQAQPAQAPQPWLPLQSLQLRYTSAPTSARTGEAATWWSRRLPKAQPAHSSPTCRCRMSAPMRRYSPNLRSTKNVQRQHAAAEDHPPLFDRAAPAGFAGGAGAAPAVVGCAQARRRKRSCRT
jgi:hypothetical protein